MSEAALRDSVDQEQWSASGSGGLIATGSISQQAGRVIQVSRTATLEVVQHFDQGYFLKRSLDILGAVMLALAFSPVIVAVFISTWLDGGDAFFKHTRIGNNRKAFKVYKFRTMVPNSKEVLRQLLATDVAARAEWEKDHKLKNDPRVTTIGKFLRRTSLDELPQILNVLRGEMSLVGPRPIVREEVRKYGRSARYYFSVKPGLTGLWQVSGRNDTAYGRRVALDRLYASRCRLLTDLFVLFKTVDVMVRGRGAY